MDVMPIQLIEGSYTKTFLVQKYKEGKWSTYQMEIRKGAYDYNTYNYKNKQISLKTELELPKEHYERIFALSSTYVLVNKNKFRIAYCGWGGYCDIVFSFASGDVGKFAGQIAAIE